MFIIDDFLAWLAATAATAAPVAAEAAPAALAMAPEVAATGAGLMAPGALSAAGSMAPAYMAATPLADSALAYGAGLVPASETGAGMMSIAPTAYDSIGRAAATAIPESIPAATTPGFQLTQALGPTSATMDAAMTTAPSTITPAAAESGIGSTLGNAGSWILDNPQKAMLLGSGAMMGLSALKGNKGSDPRAHAKPYNRKFDERMGIYPTMSGQGLGFAEGGQVPNEFMTNLFEALGWDMPMGRQEAPKKFDPTMGIYPQLSGKGLGFAKGGIASLEPGMDSYSAKKIATIRQRYRSKADAIADLQDPNSAIVRAGVYTADDPLLQQAFGYTVRQGKKVEKGPQYMAGGGMAGDGMSDSIPAVIEGRQPARLAANEFVVPADVVSHLGNGSSDAGAEQMHNMVAKIRKARTGKTTQAPKINPRKFVP